MSPLDGGLAKPTAIITQQHRQALYMDFQFDALFLVLHSYTHSTAGLSYLVCSQVILPLCLFFFFFRQFVWDVSMDLWYHVIPVSDLRTLVLPGAAAGPIPCCSLINGTPSKTRTRLVCSQRVVHARCRCVFIRMLPRGFQQIMAQSHSCSVSLNRLSCDFSAISE